MQKITFSEYPGLVLEPIGNVNMDKPYSQQVVFYTVKMYGSQYCTLARRGRSWYVIVMSTRNSVLHYRTRKDALEHIYISYKINKISKWMQRIYE